MILNRLLLIICTTFLVVLPGCFSSSSDSFDVVVFAAASLGKALREIQDDYESNNPWRLKLNYGGSQSLAQQIASGAPADMLISAGEHPVSFLQEKNMIGDIESDLLGNRLVVVVGLDSHLELSSIKDLLKSEVRRVAIADPNLAPAGMYARHYLLNGDVWEQLGSKLVFGQNVRATLAFVESGNADVAIVYVTDAMESQSVMLLDIIPTDSYPRIEYPVVVIKGSKQQRGALSFFEYIKSSVALDIFARYGFGILSGTFR